MLSLAYDRRHRRSRCRAIFHYARSTTFPRPASVVSHPSTRKIPSSNPSSAEINSLPSFTAAAHPKASQLADGFCLPATPAIRQNFLSNSNFNKPFYWPRTGGFVFIVRSARVIKTHAKSIIKTFLLLLVLHYWKSFGGWWVVGDGWWWSSWCQNARN